jgi:hypothetical protein
MGDTKEVANQTKKSKRGLRSTEEDVPLRSSKEKSSNKASGLRSQTEIHADRSEGQASGKASHSTEESHSLQHAEVHGEGSHDFGIDERQSESNVRIEMTSYFIISLITCRHQWLNG